MIGEHPLCAFNSFKFVQVWVFWFRLSWEMFLLHPKKMCLLLLLAGISIDVIRSSCLIVLFKSFINFPDNFPTAGVVKLSISPFSSIDQLIDPHGQEGTMAERLERLRGTGRNILSL